MPALFEHCRCSKSSPLIMSHSSVMWSCSQSPASAVSAGINGMWPMRCWNSAGMAREISYWCYYSIYLTCSSHIITLQRSLSLFRDITFRTGEFKGPPRLYIHPHPIVHLVAGMVWVGGIYHMCLLVGLHRSPLSPWKQVSIRCMWVTEPVNIMANNQWWNVYEIRVLLWAIQEQ